MKLQIKASGWSFLPYLILDSWLCLLTSVSSTNSVALVRLDGIGDFVIWLNAAKEFRGIYPNQRIILIANSAWAELAKTFPYWDEVWEVNPNKLVRNFVYRWILLNKIRRAGFSVAIQPTYSRTFMHGDSIIRATKARERIGSCGELSNISIIAKSVSDYWYTRLLPTNSSRLMELDRNAEFIRRLSNRKFDSSLPNIPVAARKLTKQPWREKNYIALFPGAGWSGKRWPLTHFEELANALYVESGLPIMLCGSMQEYVLCEKLAKRLKAPCVNWAGKTDLNESVEVIRGARMLISNDSSAVHIAVAVQTPSVCILGGGHYERFLPYPATLDGITPLVADHPMACFNCNWQCTQPHKIGEAMPCITNVSVDQVFRLACSILVTHKE